MTAERPQYIVEHMEDLDADADSPATFPQWALLEYKHMLSLVGPGSTVHFTGLVSSASRDALSKALDTVPLDHPRAAHMVHTAGILEFIKENGIDQGKVCLLDPRSSRACSVADAGIHQSPTPTKTPRDGPFAFFLFGGILGDDPPRDRTGVLRAMGFPTRHLGGVQMTTDTALGVTKRIVEDGVAMNLPAGEAREHRKRQREKAAGEATAGNGAGGGKVAAFLDEDDDELQGPGGSMKWITHPELHFGGGESVTMPFRYMTETTSKGVQRPLMPLGMRDHIRKDFDRAFEF